MSMLENFYDSFDEYVGPQARSTKNFNGLIDEAHRTMLESFKKGDTYDPHTFTADEQKKINSFIQDTKKKGPSLYAESAPKTPPKPIPQVPKSVPETKVEQVTSQLDDVPTKVKAPIGETKVEDTTKRVAEKVEVKNAEAPVKPPTPPKSPTVPDELPKVKTDVPDLQRGSAFLKQNRGKIALGALGVGMAKSWVDGEDDDVMSSTGKAIKTGLVATGAAMAGEHLMKTTTMQDLVKGEVTRQAKEVSSDVESRARVLKAGVKTNLAFKVGLIAVGAATVLDIGQKGKDHLDSAKIKRQQEFEMEKRRKQSKKKNQAQSYGAMQNGEIVFDLFNARTGHHKIGNAKFN